MMKHEQYLEVLKTFDDYVAIKEWAKKFDEIYPNESEDEYNTKIRKIVKSISSLVTTVKWSNMILIDTSIKPKRIKFITDENNDDNIHINQNSAKTTKDKKSVNFELLMKSLKYLSDDEDLPSRESYSHFENSGQYDGHKEYIAFEMAIRNKGATDIFQKLDYIKNIIDKHQGLNHCKEWLLNIEEWNEKFEGDPPEFTINSEQKKECIFISELPIIKFKEEMNFLTAEEDIINKESEAVIRLKVIADYLQDKLIKEYNIYKEGYYFSKEDGYFNPDDIISLDSTYSTKYTNTYNLEDEMKLVIDKLKSRKSDYMKQTADMFFMYDYYNKRIELDEQNLTKENIKFELTKYHGIEIKDLKETFSYDDCLERYAEFKDLEASFWEVEKSIINKIKIMEEFINQKLYKYILFD